MSSLPSLRISLLNMKAQKSTQNVLSHTCQRSNLIIKGKIMTPSLFEQMTKPILTLEMMT